jgi:hypothetical protein
MSPPKHQSKAAWRNNRGLCIVQHSAGHLCYDGGPHVSTSPGNDREETLSRVGFLSPLAVGEGAWHQGQYLV